MKRAERSSPLSLAIKCAAAFVVLDIVVSVVVYALGPEHVPTQWPTDIWLALHQPAFGIADIVLPRPADFEAPVPFTSWLGLALIYLAQAALIGAALGWLAAVWRERVSDKDRHAL